MIVYFRFDLLLMFLRQKSNVLPNLKCFGMFPVIRVVYEVVHCGNCRKPWVHHKIKLLILTRESISIQVKLTPIIQIFYNGGFENGKLSLSICLIVFKGLFGRYRVTDTGVANFNP